jgi:hypothetical protein
MTTTWTDDTKTAVLLIKKDGTEIIFRKGDFVSFENREDGVKIVDIRSGEEDPGPRGFQYLPWRAQEQRWATPIVSIRQPRFIICYPSGNLTYGQHIDWESFSLLDGGKCPEDNSLAAKL